MKLKKAVGNHGRPIFILFFYSFASLFLGFWASTRFSGCIFTPSVHFDYIFFLISHLLIGSDC
ncbi:hypothetical protein ES319_1Z095300v1 [Gossypium barbadense]|uniref:Uncharacterized protein n=1 Tax=Gossypium barbadense TaxID=3634 RepID=A0A5J5N7A0_GOSBA|nr:hypothetical protein ES319_1Z095300v1 [Gossypium barbadense]